jgi:hypothetical protein
MSKVNNLTRATVTTASLRLNGAAGIIVDAMVMVQTLPASAIPATFGKLDVSDLGSVDSLWVKAQNHLHQFYY